MLISSDIDVERNPADQHIPAILFNTMNAHPEGYSISSNLAGGLASKSGSEDTQCGALQLNFARTSTHNIAINDHSVSAHLAIVLLGI